MSILQLDIVPWQIITSYTSMDTCIALANAHPRLRQFIRKLAPVIMRRVDTYAATEPFQRLLCINTYTQFSAQFDFSDLNNMQPPTNIMYHHTKCAFAHDKPLRGNIHNVRWHISGPPPPPGVKLYLVVQPWESKAIPTSIKTFVSIDRAVQYVVDSCYVGYVETVWDLYSTPEYQHAGYAEYPAIEPRLNDQQFCEWLKSRNAPVQPFTRENTTAHMYQHRHLWMLSPESRFCHVWILEITI